MRRTPWGRIAPPVFVLAGLLAAGCTSGPSSASTVAAVSGSTPSIQPMTTVTEQPPSGYYSDPYPIHVAPSNSAAPQSLSGTTADILSCGGPPKPGCFHDTGINVSIGPDLTKQLGAAGATLANRINNNIFQDDSGAWQMAVTYYVHNSHDPNAKGWTTILHAHPSGTTGNGVPTDWIADTLLVGSFTDPTKADYDGKYSEDNKKLYLIYSMRLPDKQAAHDGIVAQAMDRPTQPDSAKPTVLLAPGDYNSELFDGLNRPSKFKLIETGNITVVDGKYVMAYSTGAYDEPDYKAGLAWSDTFLPAAGKSYRKITMTDTAGVWGKPGQPEVRYLLQAQEQSWPNYVGKAVLAPGVPAVIQDSGHWYLTFAGYLPTDAPTDKKTGHYLPSHRRPYYVLLTVNIPAGATVAGASDADLANWITTGSSQSPTSPAPTAH